MLELREEVAWFNWASVAKVESKEELNCSKFVTRILSELLTVVKFELVFIILLLKEELSW